MTKSKQLISIALALALAVACSSSSSEYSDEASSKNRPQHHTNKGYQNHPFVETAASKGLFFYLRRAWSSLFYPDIPDGHQLTELESLERLKSISSERITWLGHATFLINTSGVSILTDPFLSKRASPISWAGPRRIVNLPIPINKLPLIDIIIMGVHG